MKQSFHSLLRLVTVLSAVCLAGASAHAAQVGPSGHTNDFAFQPLAADWSTFSITGAAADLTTTTAMDGAVQAVGAASITAQAQADPADPPPILATASWSATGLYMQTRVTGNAATLLMCTLVNNLGGNAASATISYDFTKAVPAAEEIEGHRAYYSLTGGPGSWTVIPQFSSATPGRLTATLNVAWPGGGNLYLLWADDNGSPSPDGANQIDNFSVTATPDTQTPAAITASPQSQTVGELQPASFTVAASGNPPPTVQWYSNNVAIPGATSTTYSIGSAPLHFSGMGFRAVAQNLVSNVTYSATSDVATLTINADTVRPVLLGAVPSGTIQLVAFFSERLTTPSATTVGNYSLTGPGGSLIISNAVLDSSQTNVVLTVAALTPGVTYTLTVSGVTDLSAAANVVLPGSQVQFTAATYTGSDIGGPSGSGSTATAGNGFSVTGGGTNILGVSDQFFFNWRQIAGDFDLKVRVQDFTGSDPFAKAGLMARETLTATSKYASSFATPHVSGSFFSQRANNGVNAVNSGFFPVTYPNTWLRLRRTGAVFTGFAGVDGLNWVQLGTATLTTPASVFHVGMAVTGVAPTNAPSATATGQFRDLGDGSGGVVGNVTLPFEPAGPSSRNTGLIISEIMYHPKPSNGLEFIEIFNAGLIEENISGYRIAGAVDYFFPANTLLPAGSFLVVAKNPAALQAASGYAGALGPWIGGNTNSLPDDSGTVRLRNRTGAILLEVNYETKAPWPIAADGSGHSLVLARPSYGEGDDRAWSASDVIGGSPGRSDGYGADPLRNVVINEFLAHTDLPLEDYIELYNHSSQSVDISGAYLSDDRDTNKFRIPNGTILPARGFKTFTVNNATTGFSLSSGGERIYFINPAQTRVLDLVVFEAQANAVSSGRYPDGAPAIQTLTSRTPDATNSHPLIPNVVINELMFNPISGDDDDEYVELYNRGNSAVDLGNWRFTSGISYTFPANTILASNAYLVVAKNKTRLMARHLQLNSTNTLGNYSGTLGNGGERVALGRPDYFTVTNNNVVTTQANYIVVNDFTYVDSGRWARWADGGGSSLELIDPNADNSLPANWADSDETGKGSWTNISVTALADHVYPVSGGAGDVMNEVQVMLLGAGEALMDDVDVHAGVTGASVVSNPNFNTGLTSWTIQGNHVRSILEPVGPNNLSQCMRIRASAGGDNGANRVECPLTTTLAANTTNTIGGRFRWLRGFPIVLLRVHGGGLEAVGTLPTPANLGSPGLVNSRRVANAGPAVYDVAHAPVLPEASQPILFTARVSDPGGIASVQLRYRLDPSATVNTLALRDDGTGGDTVAADGLYTATLSAQSANSTIAFRIAATDSSAAVTLFPDDTKGEALVRVSDPSIFGSLGVYRIWMTASNLNLWTTRERLSNEAIDGTFVYGNIRAIYNSAARYRGSPFTRNPSSPNGVGVAASYVWTLPDDEPVLGTDELNLDSLEPGGSSNVRDVTALRELTAFEMLNQLNMPFSYQRYVHVVINGVSSITRNIPVYADSQQPNGEYTAMWFPDGNDGDLYKIDDWFEFDATPARQGNKSASMENFTTTGGVKKQDRYRWNWEKKANRGLTDDYGSLYAGVDALNAPDSIYVREIEANFELREWMLSLAFRHMSGDWDSYGYNRGKNSFSYRPRDGKFWLLQWDLDFSLGCNGGHSPSQNLFSVATGGATGSDNMPEVLRLFNHPHTRRMYLQALQQLADGPMQDASFMPTMDARYRALQANGVVGLTSPYVGSGAQGISVPAWIQQRRDYIRTSAGVGDFTNASFRVFSSTNVTVNNNTLLINGSAPFGVRDILVNGAAWPVTWTSVTSWTARVVINPGTNNIALAGLGFNGTTNTSTQIVTANFTGTTPSPEGLIVFNELMPNPSVQDAEFVEIVNTSSSTYDIGGWRVNGLDYTFPTGTVLTNGQFMVLVKNLQAFYATHGTNRPNIFAEYEGNLDRDGETLSLIKPASGNSPELVIDRIRFEGRLPWTPSLIGTSLQLMDNRVDNSRSSAWASQPGGGPQPLPDTWQRITRTGNLVLGTNLFFFISGLGGSCYIDDISLTVTNPGSPDIVINGGFETGTAAPWILGTNYSGSTVVNNFSRSGSQSLLLRGGGSSGNPLTATVQQFISQNPNYLTNAIYTLTYWIAIDTAPVSVTVRTVPGANLTTGGTTFVPVPAPTPVLASPGQTNVAVLTNLPPFDTVWLNELQADNATGIQDNAGDRDPWVELYNGGTNTVSLDGYYLANNYHTNLTQWPFPPGHSIAPGKFLIVWADGEPGETSGTNLHTTFRLNQTTGSVALVRLVGGAPQITDYLTYSGLGVNLSYGDFPDGQPITRKIFQAVTPRGTNVSRGINVFINEWMASNTNGLADPTDGRFDDWFELYNASDVAVDLGNYYLTDNTNNRTQFRIPNNGQYVIPPNGFLLVWADNDSSNNSTNQPDLHASFALSKSGEALGLYGPDGTTLIDALAFGPQTDDVSEGRFSDGAASRYFMTNHTPRAANRIAAGNTAPVLASIPNRVIRLGQSVNFTAMATDSDVPAQSLAFSFGLTPPAGATLNPGGMFSWTPAANQVPSTNSLSIVVTDNGVPQQSVSQGFTIIVLPQPVAGIVNGGGGIVSISFDTIVGRTYRVEYKNNLDDATWLPLAANVVATGPALTVQDNIGALPHRFYQIFEVN